MMSARGWAVEHQCHMLRQARLLGSEPICGLAAFQASQERIFVFVNESTHAYSAIREIRSYKPRA